MQNSRTKRRPKHPAYQENQKRINKMLDSQYASAFLQDNPNCKADVTAMGKVVFRNPVDYETLYRKKYELSLTNEDILRLMRNLSNGTNVMTGATLNRKFQGEVDFTCAEILLISHIFGLEKQEILDIFHLFPNFSGDNSEE